MAQGGGRDSDHTGTEISLLILGLLTCGYIYFFWKRVGPPTEAFSLQMAHWFLYPFTWVPYTSIQGFDAKIQEVAKDPESLTLGLVFYVWGYVGRFWGALLIPLMGFMAFDLYRKEKIVRQYRHKYSMETMLETVSGIFPTQLGALKSRFWEKNADTGRWASPMNPYVWAVSKGLILDLQNNRTPLKLKDIRVENGLPKKPSDYDPRRYELDRDAAQKAFAMQIEAGPLKPRRNLWEYPFPIRLISAIFIAKGLGDGRCDEWLEKAARLYSVTPKGEPVLPVFDDDDIKKFLMKSVETVDVKKVLDSHAYLVPTLMSLLLFARTRGVIVSPDFIWLRPMDTVIWRALNQTGNTVAWIEASGAMAHWQAEKALALYSKKPSPILEPCVEQAINGLDILLKTKSEGWLFDVTKEKRG